MNAGVRKAGRDACSYVPTRSRSKAHQAANRLVLRACRDHGGPVPAWSEKFLQAFIPLFVAIDPIGLAAIFLGLGQGVAPAQRQRIARQATFTGGLVALIFLFLGANIFKA